MIEKIIIGYGMFLSYCKYYPLNPLIFQIIYLITDEVIPIWL